MLQTRIHVQKNPLSKLAVHHSLRCVGLLFKIGLLLIIILSSTPTVVVSRIAEENDAPQTETTTPSDSVPVSDSDKPETPSEDGNNSGFGLFNRNPFDTDRAPKRFIWQDEKEQPEKDEESRHIQPYLDSLRRWQNPPELTDLSKLYDWKPKPKRDEKGIALPMDSNLRITGLQSVTIEANKTHYFGEGDLNRYGGYGYGGGYGSYSSGLDLGLTSSYGYEDFGYGSGFGGSGYGGGYGGGGYSSYGSGYGSGYGTSFGGYGSRGIPRATGFNLRQIQQFGLHGRVGQRTHIAVDYSAGGSGFGGGGYGGGMTPFC